MKEEKEKKKGQIEAKAHPKKKKAFRWNLHDGSHCPHIPKKTFFIFLVMRHTVICGVVIFSLPSLSLSAGTFASPFIFTLLFIFSTSLCAQKKKKKIQQYIVYLRRKSSSSPVK